MSIPYGSPHRALIASRIRKPEDYELRFAARATRLTKELISGTTPRCAVVARSRTVRA